MKRTIRQIIAGLLAVAMIIPFPAMADDWYLENGDITVNGATETAQQTVSQGDVQKEDSNPVITHEEESSTPSGSQIIINDNGKGAEVTIQDVNIDTGSNEPAISTSGNVTIHVSGDNTVKSEGTAIDAEGSLTISGAEADTAVDTSAQDTNTTPDSDSADDETTDEETAETENTLTVIGGTTGIDVDTKDPENNNNETDGELIIGNEDNEALSDVAVTVIGGTTGIDANVTVDDGNLNAYGDIHGTASEGTGIDGNLTVEDGATAVFGDDIGVDGTVTVEAPASAVIHAYTDSVTGDTNGSDNLVTKELNPDSNYVPEYSNTMFYSLQNTYHNGDTFDIKGMYNDTLCKTTYSNGGYETYLRVDNDSNRVTDITGKNATSGLAVKIDMKGQKSGQLLQIVYTVTNTTDSAVTFDLGTGADIMIGSADNAVITPLDGNTGFKMVNEKNPENNKDSGARFYFFGKGYEGVTNVDNFWYGAYSTWSYDAENAVFNEYDSKSIDYDSAASWCWLDETIDAGETLTYTVLIGVGDATIEEIVGDNPLIPPVDEQPTPEPEPTPVPVPEPEPAPTPEPEPEEPATGGQPVEKPVSVLDIKLDTVKEVIDLAQGTQDGRPMETIASEAALSTGKAMPRDSAVIVHKVETNAEETVENLAKENVGLAFTVSYLENGTVTRLPGKVTLSIPAPMDSLEGYILVFVLEDGRQIEIPYEFVDGKIIFSASQIGLYMLVKR